MVITSGAKAGTRSRLRLTHVAYYAFVIILLLAFLGGITYMFRSGKSALPVAGQAPNFSAQNISTGHAVSMQSLSGKIVLITWYYTHCTDACPLTMYRFEQVQQQLMKDGTFGKNVVLIAMTLDPKRDTPRVIEAYARHFHADQKGWYFLRTSPTNTIRVLNDWGIKVKPSTDKEFIEHTSKTELIDQNGNIRATYNTDNLNPHQIIGNIHSLVRHLNWKI